HAISTLSLHDALPICEVIAVNYISGRGAPRFEATLSDSSGKLSAIWFHGAYLRTRIYPGLTLRMRGRVRFFRGLPQMANPKWEVDRKSTRLNSSHDQI